MNTNIPTPMNVSSSPGFSPASIFQPIQDGLTAPISRGSLIQFSYMFHKPGHDPTPLVLVTDVWNQYIRGVNIHYLTFPVIKRLVQSNCENAAFSYAVFKGDEYIVSAFRQYKRDGVRRVRKLDCAFLLNVLASVRTFSPNEIEAIRQNIRQQLNQVSQPQAAPTPQDQPNPTT